MTRNLADLMVPMAVPMVGNELGEQVGRNQHTLVAGDRAHGRQCIHGLGAGDARDAIHRQRRDVPLTQRAYHLVVVRGRGMEERDEHGPFANQLGFMTSERRVVPGLFDLEHDVGIREHTHRVRNDASSGLLVLLV